MKVLSVSDQSITQIKNESSYILMINNKIEIHMIFSIFFCKNREEGDIVCRLSFHATKYE